MKRSLGSVNLWCQRRDGRGTVGIEEARALLPLVALALGARISLQLVLTWRDGWLCSAPALGRWLRHSLFFTAALILVTLGGIL